MRSLVARIGRRVAGAGARGVQVAINLAPRRGPYGGGNQFVVQLASRLKERGFDVRYRLSRSVDAVLLVECRDELCSIPVGEIRRFVAGRPSCLVVHRINECDLRKGTAGIDALLARANELATHTVFVSGWLRDHHAGRWFDRGRAHSVILPGADPRLFHPLGAAVYRGGEPFRVVTHHWSDNPMKGFETYALLDAAIAEGRLPGFELRVVGRWPRGIGWRAARLFPPASGAALAGRLRDAHGYVTASRWDPGPMHVAEALQCGLPVAYHEDGGGIAEQAAGAGVAFREDALGALRLLRERLAELREAAVRDAPCGDRMCLEYARLFERLLAARAWA